MLTAIEQHRQQLPETHSNQDGCRLRFHETLDKGAHSASLISVVGVMQQPLRLTDLQTYL